MKQKMKEYFGSGTRLAWIVDPPTRSVAVYTGPTEEPDRLIHENQQLNGGEVLPGFTLKVAEIFPAAK
jgi:Uma2 family endonuclease